MQSGYTDETTATQDPSIDVFAELMGRMNEIDEHIDETVESALQEAWDPRLDEISEQIIDNIAETEICRYCGTVNTFDKLPQDANIGDIYNVITQYGDNLPRSNYVWSGTAWDCLSGSFHLDIATDQQVADMLSEQLTLDALVGSAVVGSATVS